jgi:hypothetical protein
MSIQLNQFPCVFTQSFVGSEDKIFIASAWIKSIIGYEPTSSDNVLWINNKEEIVIKGISNKYPAKVMPMPSEAMLELLLNSMEYEDDQAFNLYQKFTDFDKEILLALGINGFSNYWTDDSANKIMAAYGYNPVVGKSCQSDGDVEYSVHARIQYGAVLNPIIQDKMIWRTFIRPLFEGCGTPVTVTPQHLPELLSMVNRMSEFTTSAHSNGRVHHGAISAQDLSNIHDVIDYLHRGCNVAILD